MTEFVNRLSKDDMPAIRSISHTNLECLKIFNRRVGMVVTHAGAGTYTNSSISSSKGVELDLGSRGRLDRRLAKFSG